MAKDVYVGKHRVTDLPTYLRLNPPNRYGQSRVDRIIVNGAGYEDTSVYSYIHPTPEKTVEEIFEGLCDQPHFWVHGFSDYAIANNQPLPQE